MVDVGTNGEIALWCGRRRELFITSVAAGPAFERAGITGSQIISSVAGALESGAIDPTGQVVVYSLLQEEPRRMPTFYMVRPSSED